MKNFIFQYKKYVTAVIYKLTGNVNEDLEQEVYIKTWQNMEGYKEEGKFKQWICMIAANVCRDYFRSKSFKSEEKEVYDNMLLENVSVSSKIEEQIDSKERQKTVLKAVDDLPKIYREVIVLVEFEDYSLAKAANKLRIPEGTVKSRLFKAKEILKTKLTNLLGE